MSSSLAVSLAVLITMTGAMPAIAQGTSNSAALVKSEGMRAVAVEFEVLGKVVELDLTGRPASIRRPNGEVVTFMVPASVTNLDQVMPGDDVVIRYAQAVAVTLSPVQGPGIRERVESSTLAAANPGKLSGRAGGARWPCWTQ
jgi:hypothetical protein